MRLDIKFEETSTALDVKFTEHNQTFDADFGEIQKVLLPSDYPIYAGDYVVTPKAEEKQVLETKEKVLMADVTINAVPYFETSNLSGGNTVYIGTEVNK